MITLHDIENCNVTPLDCYVYRDSEQFKSLCAYVKQEYGKIIENKKEKEMTKTFDRKDVYSWANCNELRLATYGYIGNSLADLTNNITPDGIVQLLSIDENSAECFVVENKQNNLIKTYHFAFFLPTDKVDVEIEKKLRPFKSVKEFVETTGLDIGQCVFIRQTKGEYAKQWTTKALITSITDYIGDTPSITFGDDCWSVEELAEKYEYSRDTTRWYPFGVEE